MGLPPSEVGGPPPNDPKLSVITNNSNANGCENYEENVRNSMIESPGQANQPNPTSRLGSLNQAGNGQATMSSDNRGEEQMEIDEIGSDPSGGTISQLQDQRLVSAICTASLQLSSGECDEVKELIKFAPKNGGMVDTLGYLKDKLKCPHCSGDLKRRRGKPGEYLVCEAHDKISKFELAKQIPSEIMKAYFGKMEAEFKQEWSIKFGLEESNVAKMDMDDESDSEQNPVKIILSKEQKKVENPTEEQQKGGKSAPAIGAVNKENTKVLENKVEEVTQQVRKLTNLEKLAEGKPFEEVVYLLVQTVGQIADRLGIFEAQNARREMVVSRPKLDKDNSNEAQPYLKAIETGKANRENRLTGRNIRSMCAYSYSERKIDRLVTIHFRGIRKCPYHLVWELFDECGVDRRRVKWLSFVNYDTLEVDIFESYIPEFTTLIESIHKLKEEYKDLIVKRVKFEALDRANIRNDAENKDPAIIFDKRMQKKAEKIQEMIVKAPQLNRLLKYVKLQKEKKSFDIPINKPIRYEDSATAIINQKLEKAMESEKKSATESKEVEQQQSSNSISIPTVKTDTGTLQPLKESIKLERKPTVTSRSVDNNKFSSLSNEMEVDVCSNECSNVTNTQHSVNTQMDTDMTEISPSNSNDVMTQMDEEMVSHE